MKPNEFANFKVCQGRFDNFSYSNEGTLINKSRLTKPITIDILVAWPAKIKLTAIFVHKLLIFAGTRSTEPYLGRLYFLEFTSNS